MSGGGGNRTHETFPPPPEQARRAKIAAAKRGPANPNWTEEPSFWAAHTWLLRNVPKTGACQRCGREGPTDYAFRRHPLPHTRDPADYIELCRRCHMLDDGRLPALVERNRARGARL